MDVVYKELDEAKAEIETLKEQYRAKVELADNAKNALAHQIKKNEDASSKLNRLEQDLIEKGDEIFMVKSRNEEIESHLTEKESIIRHLTSLHERFLIDHNEKIRKCEEDYKILGLAMEESNEKNMDQEQKIRSLEEEIERLKNILSASQNRRSESKEDVVASKEVERKEAVYFKLDEEKRTLEDRLKWKNEQFGHLEEAHQKLRKDFKLRNDEWEKEKNELLDQVYTLQTNLESQTKILNGLQNRLEMCSQALAHAESKTKRLEVQLSESRADFDMVCAEYEEAKSELESLKNQSHQDVVNMRSTLGTKEILLKEMEYQFKKVEQEKKDLTVSLSRFQESQIYESGGSASSSKLQKKLRSLEQVHKDCLTNLQAKESGWHSEMESLSEALKSKDMTLNALNKELEACDSLILKLELLNQETSLMLLILRSKISEAQCRLADDRACFDQENERMENKISDLVGLLEAKEAALTRVGKDLEEEREKVIVFSEKVHTLEELQFPLQKEQDRLREMLKESSTCRMHSDERVFQLQSDLSRVRDALSRTDEELDEKLCEANELGYELHVWKSRAEQLEANLKENYRMRAEMEASLIEQTEVEVNLKQENESLDHLLEEKNKEIGNLQQQLCEVNGNSEVEEIEIIQEDGSFENAEVNQKESQQIEQEWVKNHEYEKQILQQLMEEKDQRIYNLQQLIESLEKEFESSSSSFSASLSRMQDEMIAFHKSWEKIKTAEVLKEMEIQEKNLMLSELENDLANSEKNKQESKAALETKSELEGKIRTLSEEKMRMLGDISKLSSENKNLINTMKCLCDRVGLISLEDIHLMENLGKMVQKMDVTNTEITSYEDGYHEHDDLKENDYIMKPLPSSSMKNEELFHDERSPFRALNH